MLKKKAYETADGRKFETLEAAIVHAAKMQSQLLPEYVWRNGAPCYVLRPDKSQAYVENEGGE